MKPYLASIFVCLFSWLHSSLAQNFVHMQTLTGKTGGGNYTYYKLLRNGNIRILLTAIQGDSDIYISETVLHPTYETYDLQSTTCGEDIIDIPDTYKRPVGIGIYGHPAHMESTYVCQILIELTDGEHSSSIPDSTWTSDDREEESLLWTIFVNILKVVIDILV